jgi:hypothetical protein
MRPSRSDVRAPPPPRIIYVASDDWYFLSHCLTMARAARAAGFEVHVAANVGEEAASIRAEDFVVHAIRFRRGKPAPFRMLHSILALRRVYRAVAPAIVHHVTPLSMRSVDWPADSSGPVATDRCCAGAAAWCCGAG